MKQLYTSLVLSAFFFMSAYGQSTYNEVYQILQNNCTTCHNSTDALGGLDLSLDPTTLYANLVDTDPVNSTAQAKGDKMIDPGYPARSFLMRKLAYSAWDDYYSLDMGEGTPMPLGEPSLEKKEVELIRQWILAGAPFNDEVIDPTILEDFFDNGMALPGVTAPPAPDPSEGYQLRLGPFFLTPFQEREIFLKHDLRLDEGTEVHKIEVNFNIESHHFIIYQLEQGAGQFYPEGLRDIEDGEFAMLNNTFVAAWQDDNPYDLPDGTAYLWEGGTELDLNYHLVNYYSSGILPAEVYVNIYTQDEGTADQKMWSLIVPIDISNVITGNGNVGESLVIPNNGDEITFSEPLLIPPLPFPLPFPGGTWHIWMLSSHTHARGTDYDIYKRNFNGTKGEQLYEGFYDFSYQFNQGYYDWSHPPIRFFDPPVAVDMGITGGVIHEAKYVNNTDETLYWGNSVDDEMMLFFIQFTEQPFISTGIEEIEEVSAFDVFPNPFEEQCSIRLTIDRPSEVTLEIVDVLGAKVSTIVEGLQPPGTFHFVLDNSNFPAGSGVYFVRLSANGQTTSQKIVRIR
ncbi:MAG: T9SS type A sorting domain-containing protein [Bacteroidota bacterium]